VAEAVVRSERGHAGHLLESVRFLLDRAGWGAATPDVFVTTTGPGSFTGLRIGIGTIAGLALAAGRPAAGVSTLAAMAAALGPVGRRLAPLLDAGRGEVFVGLFDGEDPPRLLAPERVLRPAELLRWLPLGTGEPILVFGSGALRYRETLSEAGGGVRVLPNSPPAAAGAGRLAVRLLEGGGSVSELPLAARYLRRADARLPGGLPAHGAEGCDPAA
jgi:tRNA threonylcarbamoyladenosine biosynthesis protein TsaB